MQWAQTSEIWDLWRRQPKQCGYSAEVIPDSAQRLPQPSCIPSVVEFNTPPNTPTTQMSYAIGQHHNTYSTCLERIHWASLHVHIWVYTKHMKGNQIMSLCLSVSLLESWFLQAYACLLIPGWDNDNPICNHDFAKVLVKKRISELRERYALCGDMILVGTSFELFNLPGVFLESGTFSE